MHADVGFTAAARALALSCPRTAVASIVLGGARIRDSDDASVRIVPFRKIANLAHSHTRSASACVADVRMAIASSSPVPLCIRTYAESVGLLGRSEGARVPAHLLPGYPIPLLFTPRSSCNDRPHVPSCRAGRVASRRVGARASRHVESCTVILLIITNDCARVVTRVIRRDVQVASCVLSLSSVRWVTDCVNLFPRISSM